MYSKPPRTRVGPRWLFRPEPDGQGYLPVAYEGRVEVLAGATPVAFEDLARYLRNFTVALQYGSLNPSEAYPWRDVVVNEANDRLWARLDELLAGPPAQRLALVTYAREFFPPRAARRVLRALSRDPDAKVRAAVRKAADNVGAYAEVAVPVTRTGEWNSLAWRYPLKTKRHATGAAVLAAGGLPVLETVAQLRALLGVTRKELGLFLTATSTAAGRAPYTTRTVPKRSGGERLICAPVPRLKFVQRKILDEVLAKVPVHPAAHGFVPGRSTVTNARAHVGQALVVKFDLKDFFPTVGYPRLVGLFCQLGYPLGDGRFGTRDHHTGVAPTLARLCSYAPDPRAWQGGFAPQGAPTSPQATNLVCRRLDNRLSGLAARCGGVYTRYADDLTFSFGREAAAALRVGRFRWWVDQVCRAEGFTVNQDKFRAVRRGRRQLVTGIVVNEKTHLPREDRRLFRAVLHGIRSRGLAAEIGRRPNFLAWVAGFAAYLKMVHAEDGPAILAEAKRLLAGG